ncbi:MAG: helicase-exonuclease AddAB subunit AddA [Eubacteriales bacterium]|nr:helicase-exonuclease AddAB subunit AddA [Eubacteriales bacterium]MDD3198710.1 helicase-exonuclease AddAB subunit AddA [Eubacteriales bacterium]MDD4629044.1 helicase-exonuclease AddAB subunit AddA [Eubacteriales bacterium]
MKWTKEQKEAIEIREKNILVSAAAGSGKTAVLVERIKQLIIRDHIPLDRMLIVTFSNAAASEMREKIVAAISNSLEGQREESQSSRNVSFLREQLNMIHRTNISTFHAFSMEVIRRYFYLIDIEPDFKICDEAQKTILQAEAMEQLFSNMFESRSQDFLEFLNKYALTKNDEAVKEMIFEAHRFVQSIPDSFKWLRKNAEELSCTKEDFEKSAAFREIKGEIARSLSLAENCFNKAEEFLENHGISSLIPKCRIEAETVKKLCSGFETLPFDEFGTMISGVEFQRYTASRDDKESYEEIKETIASLREQGKSIIKKLVSQYFARPLESYVSDLNRTHKDALYLCYIVEEFDRLYKEKKQNRGLIDFNDIEHYALAVLSNEAAACEYRNKFDYIFIDEYQDSNIVQETLISKIKRENNLFMVGDVKQSIYKFRLAEPEIFISKYEEYKKSNNDYDIKLDLNKNFRSKGRIIAAVNDIFSQIMHKDMAGLEYGADAALYQGAPYEGELDYPVEFHIVDEKQIDDLSIDDEIKEMKRAELEAHAAVQIISEFRGCMIYDSKSSQEKAITNKDIVVLLRSAKNYADIYYEVLMKEGIPSFVDAGDGYFDTLEIEIFLNLLRVIDNRKQDIPLLSILRSPVFSFTIEELIVIRIHDKEGAYNQSFQRYAEKGPDAVLKEKCEAALSRINKWKKEASVMPLEDFLWMLIRETGYYEFVGSIPGGSQRQANLRALADKAVQFQNSQMKGIFSFINYIEAIKKRQIPMGQVKLIGENDDVVRIMTIHKSKGLEFPMVIIGGLGKRFNRESNTYRISLHKEIGLGMRFVDKENSCYRKTLIQTAIDQKKRREGMAEELRILYVAFTRAKDKLMLLGTMKDIEKTINAYSVKGEDFTGAKSYMDFLIPALEHTKVIVKQFSRRDIGFRQEKTDQRKALIYRLINEELDFVDHSNMKQEINRRLGHEYAHKEALQLKSKFTVSELSKLINDQNRSLKMTEAPQKEITVLEAPKFTKDRDNFTGAEKGIILHKVMEQMDFQNMEAKKEVVGAFVKDLINREILASEEAKAVSYEKIIGFLNSEIGKRAGKARNIYKEVSFNMMKEISGEKIIIQGTIDCYFEEDGKYVLLDYKSDYIPDKENEEEVKKIIDGYRPQLGLYKEALEMIRNIKVEEAYLYLFYIGKAVRIF